MKIPGTYPKGAFTRIKQQTRSASPIFSSQQEVIIESFTGVELQTYLSGGNPYGVLSVTDDDYVLPYSTVEFTFHNTGLLLSDTPYVCHIIVPLADVQGETAVHVAQQINSWARIQGITNPNLLSMHATAEVINFLWAVRIKMPWGMLAAPMHTKLIPTPSGGSMDSYECIGIDHPLMMNNRGGRFGMFEIGPQTPYKYYYYYGSAYSYLPVP